jgi:cytochrome c5
MFTPYRRVLAAVVLLIALAACSPGGEEQPGEEQAGGERVTPEGGAAATGREVQQDWRTDRQALGKATYDKACAACHDAGEGDAPRTGVREDWSERSDLWQAVLFKHAKAGYLEMPGKGGQPELTDQAVEAAAEYMLGLTFPELPRD